jgi:hypothetical protein
MTLNKMLHILQHGTDIAPEFIETAKALAETLTGDDQAKLQAALAAARVRSDELHADIQDEAEKASKAK